MRHVPNDTASMEQSRSQVDIAPSVPRRSSRLRRQRVRLIEEIIILLLLFSVLKTRVTMIACIYKYIKTNLNQI